MIEADRLMHLLRLRLPDIADWAAAETSPGRRICEIDNRRFLLAAAELASAVFVPFPDLSPAVAIVILLCVAFTFSQLRKRENVGCL